MYKPELILPDSCMYGVDNAFNANHFFFEIDCFLKEYRLGDFTAGNIITSWCAQTNINQRMILVTLQREQGLLSKKEPVGEDILDKATGCGVWDDGTVIPQFKGFFNQVKGACKTYQKWFMLWQKGTEMKLLDGTIIVPENATTYALYKYTPHISAGKLTYDVYSRYFPKNVI